MISSTGNLVHIATLRRNTFDENGWIFESYWVVYSKLPVIICSHGIHIVIIGDKDGVRIATSQQADWDIIGTELWQQVGLVSSQFKS